MTSERMKILEMVAEGKLTVEEATHLLKSIGRSDEGAEEVFQTVSTVAETGPQTELRVESPDVQPEVAVQVVESDRPVAPESSPERAPVVQGATSVEHAAPTIPETASPEPETESERGLWDWLKQFMSWLGPKETYEEEFDWAFESAGITAISAQTTNGSIKFAGSEQGQVLVYARKVVKASSLAAAKEFAQQVQIHVEQNGDQLQIYKEHPKPPMGVEVSISYRLQSPPAVDLALQTTNGSLQVERAEGAVEVKSTNGKIQLDDVTGHIQAKTTNGGIRVKLAALKNASDFTTTNGSIEVDIHQGVAPLSASTTNGSINLTLPADFSGQLDAGTTNGRVQTEFQVLSARQSRNRLVGQLGANGDTPIKLRTVNGGIRLGLKA